MAADEMYKFLRNFVKNSPKHLEICNLFAKLLNFKEVSPHELEAVYVLNIKNSFWCQIVGPKLIFRVNFSRKLLLEPKI